jgi:hypothetical protein
VARAEAAGMSGFFLFAALLALLFALYLCVEVRA